VVRFFENSLSFYQLNISCADIPCVLKNGVVGGARSTQPVNIDPYVKCGTLHISVNITPPSPNLHNSSPSIPTEYNYSTAKEATIPGRIRLPVPDTFLPVSHHRPAETGPTTTMPGPIQFPVPEPFYPRRITNAPKLARPCHRVRKR